MNLVILPISLVSSLSSRNRKRVQQESQSCFFRASHLDSFHFLQPKLKSVRTIACFAIVAKSLQMHVTEGMQRRWVFPVLSETSGEDLDALPANAKHSNVFSDALSSVSSIASASDVSSNSPDASKDSSSSLSNGSEAFSDGSDALSDGTDASGKETENGASSQNGALKKRRRLTVEGLVPFWLDSDAVPNSVSIESMVLLTGPNTSGGVMSFTLLL